MKHFDIGDKIDAGFVKVISHEFAKCSELFHLYRTNQRLLNQNSEKAVKIRNFNYYTGFLVHLYEFYISCFQRDSKSLKEIKGEAADNLFKIEILRNLLVEESSAHMVTLPYNLGEVTIETLKGFPAHFRYVRNNNVHVKIDRAISQKISLSEFYKRYNGIVELLYIRANYSWQIEDVLKYNLGEIEEFTINSLK